jgi:hypothetical protein
MIWDLFPGLIPRGRLQWDTHEASVEHAPGFSGARTRLKRCGCHEGLGMIRDSFTGINSPGQAPVDHALGFSGSCTRLQLVVF